MHAKLVRISQNSFFHILLILLIQFYFLDYFRFFPMSEDAGFYAFMSKSVVNGSVLHKDIPLSSNSISIYFLAFLMNLFETSLEVFRMYYLFFLFLCLLLSILFQKKNFNL